MIGTKSCPTSEHLANLTTRMSVSRESAMLLNRSITLLDLGGHTFIDEYPEGSSLLRVEV